MESDCKTIFLVDDNTTNLAVGSDALEEYYEVLTLNSGKRLLKALERITPDLILLDVAMPEMDGYDVIRQLKGNPATADIPVMFLTAMDEAGKESKGLSMGAVDYIIKPFNPVLLRKKIEAYFLTRG
jgi:putative two-component system response regulator